MKGAKEAKNAKEALDCIRENLARGFLTVYMANQMGISYKSAEKYADGEIGNLWLSLADIALKSVNENLNDTFGKH